MSLTTRTAQYNANGEDVENHAFIDQKRIRSQRVQQLAALSSMQPTYTNEEEKSINRVHAWVAQQHKFTGIPPPEEEPSLFRSQSTIDMTSRDVSSTADSTTFTDWLPSCPSEDEINKFGGIEVSKFYSPNMTRRRGYVPRSDPSLNNTQYAVSSNRTNLSQLSRQYNGDTRGSPVASSCRGSSIACSPLSRYFYQSGEGNTFPRRNKISNKKDSRNLFTSAIMDYQADKVRVSCPDERYMPRHDKRFISNPYDERSKYYKPLTSEGVEQVLKDETIISTENPPFLTNGVSLGVTQEFNNVAAEKNSSLIGNMSLDTQRLLSGNLPDVALTAAKAIHKRELSDSLPKYKGAIKSLFHHLRMSSAPETSYCGDEDKTNTCNKKYKLCEIRKVKALSWPKRAMLPSYKAFIKGEVRKSNTVVKTGSGYKTGKSEEKKNVVIVDNDNKTANTHINIGESVHSDQSDLPPARPPLPSPKVYSDKKLSSNFPLSSHDIRVSSTDAHSKHSLHTDHHSSISSTRGKSTDTCHKYTSIKYLRRRDAADCTVSAFCSSSTDLTRNVSMSLKDLIRIHEEEIARVSGAGFKGNDSMHDKYRKCSISESKARSKAVWKRHTTIGLLTHFNGIDTEKDILDYKTTDKLPLSIGNEVVSSSEKSSVAFYEPTQSDYISPPFSPVTSLVKYDRKRNAPLTLPKPNRPSLKSLILDTGMRKSADIEKSSNLKSPKDTHIQSPLSPLLYKDTCIQSTSSSTYKDASIQSPLSPSLYKDACIQSPSSSTYKDESIQSPLSPSLYKDASIQSPLSDSLYKDACVQTDLALLDLNENEYAETLLLVNEKKELESKFEKEKQVMNRKLEEQKKVANAYQKLEDRYRRKVYELQKALHMCTCSRVKAPAVKLDTSHCVDMSYSKYAHIYPDNHDISVQKVDGILHQLEAWLNNQTNGIHTDTSDLSSFIGSNEGPYHHGYRVTSEHYTSPPLEIIDRIDATSV